MEKYDGPKLIKKGVNRWIVVYANELHNPIMFESEEYKFHKARRIFSIDRITDSDKARLILSGGKP